MTSCFLRSIAHRPLRPRAGAGGGRHSCREASRLVPMQLRQPCQNRCAPLRDVDSHKSAVRLALSFADQASLGRPLHQADDGVVTPLQKFGEFADSGPFTVRVARDAQQELVLLGSDAFRSCRLFAEAQESPEVVTKPGEVPDQLAIQDFGVTASVHRGGMAMQFHQI
jgi:hypothetical protein